MKYRLTVRLCPTNLFCWFLVLALAACGSVSARIDAGDVVVDSASPSDAPPDAPLDAPPDVPPDACISQPLFIGGSDPQTQGWMVAMDGTAFVTTSGPTITQLQTQTTAGAGAILLLVRPNVVTPGTPWGIEVVMEVFAANPHNFLDSAAVIMGSYSAPTPDGDQRGEMIYLDGDSIGWADDTQSAAANNFDNRFHTYQLLVDAAGNATVTRDGANLLTRAGFTTTGSIAIGDQTNDPNVESTLLVRSISRLCR